MLIGYVRSVPSDSSTGGLSTAFSIDLSLFSAHFAEETTGKAEDDGALYYTYPCRCSGTYIVTRNQLEDGVEILNCDGCSERCRVEYVEEVGDDL